MRYFAYAAFFPSVLMIIAGFVYLHQDLLLRYNGQTLSAHVTQTIIDTTEADFESHFIEYEFGIDVTDWVYLSEHKGCLPVDIKARPIHLICRSKEAVPEKVFATIQIGDAVPVSYRLGVRDITYRTLEYSRVRPIGIVYFFMGLICVLITSIMAVQEVRESWSTSSSEA